MLTVFTPADLLHFDAFLGRHSAVIALRDVHAGNLTPSAAALRHDVDENRGSFETAQNMARWEAARGYRSTYFVLHGANYWDDAAPFFRAGLEEIALAGHEIGIHVNALAEALKTGDDPDEILWEALETLRSWGHPVIGAASHGDVLCRQAEFVNYQQFYGVPGGEVPLVLRLDGTELVYHPAPLAEFGLAYEAYHLPRGYYLSDTGGSWNHELAALDPPAERGAQLQILQHPDWWGAAISRERTAA